MLEPGRSRTGPWSSRGRVVRGVPCHPPFPPLHIHSYISHPESWEWLCLGCALAAMGEAGGDDAWLLPPYWAPKPKACRAGLLMVSVDLPPSLLPVLDTAASVFALPLP